MPLTINYKLLQGSVATYLRYDGVVNNQIKKDLLLSLWVKKLKSVNILQSYKQQCVMYFARLANTLLKTKESSSKKINIGLTELWSWVCDPTFFGPPCTSDSWPV